MNIYIALFGLLVVVVAIVVWSIYPSQKRLNRFKDRTELSSEQIYEQFFLSEQLSKELALELWNEVADILKVPPGKLRPTDRFDNELAPEKGWEFDDELGLINLAAQARFKKSGKIASLEQIKTLGDYVRFFAIDERVT